MDPRTEKMLAEHAEKIAATPAPLRGPLSAFHDARGWMKKNAGTAKLLAGAGLVVLIAIYYLTVTLPAQRADRFEMESRAAERLKADVTSRQDVISECLTKAKADADEKWAATCKSRRQGPNCALPERQADAFEKAEKDARNACLLGH